MPKERREGVSIFTTTRSVLRHFFCASLHIFLKTVTLVDGCSKNSVLHVKIYARIVIALLTIQ